MVIRPKRALELITTALRSDSPIMVWGSPGIGKSDIIRQAADGFGIDYIDVRASQLDPVDIRGVPSILKGTTIWNPPDFLPRDPETVALLFLDELPQAPQLVQSSLFQLVLDRKVGGYTLPEGVRIVAAGNRRQDRSGTFVMPAALANRFVHIELEPHIEDWLEWAEFNDIRQDIIAFLSYRTALLNNFDAAETVNATPRTWAVLSSMLNHKAADDDDVIGLATCVVGKGPAAEFAGFCRVWQRLVPYAAIVKSPHSADLPKEPDAVHAVASMLYSRVDKKDAGNVGVYVQRLPAEAQAVFIAGLSRRAPALLGIPSIQALVSSSAGGVGGSSGKVAA